MSGHYSFTSCFAPFIESMITEKRNAGFQYEHAEWILHKFDEFCNQEQVETPVITQELAGKWGTLRKTETKVTLAGRISVLRQLSLYMQAYGIKCYVPRNFTRKSNRSAYVLSIEEIQSLFLEIDSYQPTINAEVFHRLALEYRILFRILFCCGLRVSEARKLRLDMVDLENGVLKIYQSKGSNDRLVYLPDDLRQLCCEYLKIMTVKYKIKSEWFFPASDPAKVKELLERALGVNAFFFFGTMLIAIAVMFTGASSVQAAAGSEGTLATGMGYIAAALVTGLSCIGGGIAVASAASAALGAISEDQSILGKSLIFVGLAEGVALYGLIISFMILGQL